MYGDKNLLKKFIYYITDIDLDVTINNTLGGNKKMKKYIVLGIAILFVGASVATSLHSEVEDNPLNPPGNGWWNTDWLYRKELNISDSSDDYQMLIQVWKENGHDNAGNDVIDCEDNCSGDFSDLRFVDNDQTTLLSYWIEEMGTSGGDHYAQFWVKTSGDNSIYMYYGNSEASSISNGDETFIFFDDFDTYNTNVWSEFDPDGVVTISATGGMLHIAFGSVSGGSIAGAVTKNTVATDALVVAKVKGERGTDSYNHPYQLRIIDNNGNNMRNTYRQSGGTSQNRRYFRNFRVGAIDNHQQISSSTYTSLSWRTIYLKKLQNWQAAGVFSNYFDGSRIGSESTDNFQINEPFVIRIQAGSYDNNLDSYCDWVFVAKYDSTEPEWESFSEQEPLYNLEIGDIKGGLFRVKADIKNIGFAEITDANWDITLDGGLILLGGHTPGIISIPLGGEETVKSNVVLGLGQIIITVNAQLSPYTSDTKDQEAQVFLIFIII